MIVWPTCTNAAAVRPARVTIACADANLYATGLRWSRWSAAGAVARGTGHVNDCTPYCAAGHFHTFPIVVRLSKPIRCNGRVQFARIEWSGKQHGSYRLGCRT